MMEVKKLGVPSSLGLGPVTASCADGNELSCRWRGLLTIWAILNFTGVTVLQQVLEII
jgi:hypothetical protein